MVSRRLVRLAAFALLLAPAFAHADWPATGKFVGLDLYADNGVGPCRIVDLPSGDIALLASGFGRGPSYGYGVARLSRNGDIVFATNLSSMVAGYPPEAEGFSPDDSDGVWHFYSYSAEHVTATGTREPSNTAYGWNVSLPFLVGVSSCAGPRGDAYVTDGVAITRFRRTGTRASGWPTQGLQLVDFPFSPLREPDRDVLPDGSGGAIVLAYDGTRPLAFRVDSNAVLHAGWPSTGLVLGPDPISGDPPPHRALVASGAGSFVAMWLEGGYPATTAVIQRFGLDGAIAPGWPSTGVVAATGLDSLASVTLVADGQGGAYLVWLRGKLPVASHVLGSGVFATGLDAHGVSPLDAGAQYRYCANQLNGLLPRPPIGYLVADHTTGGGLAIAWDDRRSGEPPSMRVRWLLTDLTRDPATPDAGVILTPTGDGSTGYYPGDLGDVRAAHDDGAGGLYLAWNMWGTSVSQSWVHGKAWMTHVARPLLADAGAPLASDGLLLRPPFPNPVRDALALRMRLPDAWPAQLELFDVAGRRQRFVEVSGAGDRVASFERVSELPPGLYLARLTQGSRSSSVRVVVAR